MKITLEQVAQAYHSKGLIPEAGHVEVRGGKCCALGALGHPMVDYWERTSTYQGELLGVNGHDFGMGFDDGFTGEPRTGLIDNPNDYDNGYAIGKAIVQKLEELRPATAAQPEDEDIQF